MNKIEIKKMLENKKIGYACVFAKDDGKHTDYMFPMTAKNIANFIESNKFAAEKIIIKDLRDYIICESVFGGFLSECPNLGLRNKIMKHLLPLQMGEKETKEIAMATLEEVERKIGRAHV